MAQTQNPLDHSIRPLFNNLRARVQFTNNLQEKSRIESQQILKRFDIFHSGQYLNENLREQAEDWHTSIHVSRWLLKISMSKIDRTPLTTALCINPALKARTLLPHPLGLQFD